MLHGADGCPLQRCVSPGRMVNDGDLVGPSLFLISDASAYVTGTELRVDGGFTAW